MLDLFLMLEKFEMIVLMGCSYRRIKRRDHNNIRVMRVIDFVTKRRFMYFTKAIEVAQFRSELNKA